VVIPFLVPPIGHASIPPQLLKSRPIDRPPSALVTWHVDSKRVPALGHPQGMAYSMLRFGKLKSPTQVKASRDHCTRTRETRNAIPRRRPSIGR